eukprot:2466-Heterococcus_DN1.PRE.1
MSPDSIATELCRRIATACCSTEALRLLPLGTGDAPPLKLLKSGVSPVGNAPPSRCSSSFSSLSAIVEKPDVVRTGSVP